MGLCAPWANYYLHIWIKPPNLDHQTLMNLLPKTVMYIPNLDKTITK